MIKRLFQSRLAVQITSISLIIVIGLSDYLTGIEFSLFIFYYIPISIAAWHTDKKLAIFNSILSMLILTSTDILLPHNYSHWSLYIWNGGIRLIAFLTIAIGVSMVKHLLDVEKELSKNLQKTLEEIKILKGFLPICASCKNIRNDRGYWEQIEHYIATHSEAEFTHTLCPDCMKKLYPDIDISS